MTVVIVSPYSDQKVVVFLSMHDLDKGQLLLTNVQLQAPKLVNKSHITKSKIPGLGYRIHNYAPLCNNRDIRSRLLSVFEL